MKDRIWNIDFLDKAGKIRELFFGKTNNHQKYEEKTMRKEDFLEIGKDLEGFEVLEPKQAPPGINAKDLWDLWDIGIRFGNFTPRGIGFRAGPLLMEFFNFGHCSEGMDGFIVGRYDENSECVTTEDGRYVLRGLVDIFELKNGMRVLWDTEWSVQGVKEEIEKIDRLAVELGEKINGQRQEIFWPPKLKEVLNN